MAGQLICVVGKQTFSIYVSTSGTPTNTILGNRMYSVADAVSGVLTARVASCSGIPTGATLTVTVFNAMAMSDDPGNVYALPTGNPIASITISPSDTFPRLYVAGFTNSSTTACGPQVAFALAATNGSSAGSATITLGVDFLIRDRRRSGGASVAAPSPSLAAGVVPGSPVMPLYDSSVPYTTGVTPAQSLVNGAVPAVQAVPIQLHSIATDAPTQAQTVSGFTADLFRGRG
jgi:hypothetical protein